MSLRTDAVSSELWELLVRLMCAEPLNDFYLVGGTALALRYGHRMSIDIDLFTDRTFDAHQLSEFLTLKYGLCESSTGANSVSGVIDGIKVDCIGHRYAVIGGIQRINQIRLLSVEDIAAMKLNAIANRGSKKDFWDLHELTQHFERVQLLSFYEKKYPQASAWAVEKSMSYFEDAERDPDPRCLKAMTWNQVKTELAEWNRL